MNFFSFRFWLTIGYRLPDYVAVWVRGVYLRLLVKKMGVGSYISRDVSIGGFDTLEIGEHVSINQGCNLYADFGISIGSYSKLSPYVQLYSANYIYKKDSIIGDNGIRGEPIVIGENVWVGAGSVILSGVHIGDNAVVGALSLVNCDIPPGELWAGNPIRFIKKIT